MPSRRRIDNLREKSEVCPFLLPNEEIRRMKMTVFFCSRVSFPVGKIYSLLRNSFPKPFDKLKQNFVKWF